MGAIVEPSFRRVGSTALMDLILPERVN